jgi:hypothetical protein
MAIQSETGTLPGPVGPEVRRRAERLGSDFGLWRICAWSGPVFLFGLTISFVVIAGFVPPPREHWTAAHVARFYRQHDTRIRLGMESMILVACLYYFWSLAIARVMDRTEAPDSPLTRIQVFGGFSTAWVTAATGLAFLVASFRAGQRSATDVRLINDIGFLVFNMTAMFTFFQVVAIGIAFVRPDRERAVVPRWVGYLCFWEAATYLVVFLIPFLQHGPFAWHGLITFYVVLALFGAWVILVSWHVIRAIGTIEQRVSG